jgi:hypothetical protein
MGGQLDVVGRVGVHPDELPWRVMTAHPEAVKAVPRTASGGFCGGEKIPYLRSWPCEPAIGPGRNARERGRNQDDVGCCNPRDSLLHLFRARGPRARIGIRQGAVGGRCTAAESRRCDYRRRCSQMLTPLGLAFLERLGRRAGQNPSPAPVPCGRAFSDSGRRRPASMRANTFRDGRNIAWVTCARNVQRRKIAR